MRAAQFGTETIRSQRLTVAPAGASTGAGKCQGAMAGDSSAATGVLLAAAVRRRRACYGTGPEQPIAVCTVAALWRADVPAVARTVGLPRFNGQG